MDQTFQVNLRGIIDLLSNHIYSGPEVFVRELLQNAVDALTARAELVSQPPVDMDDWRVRVHVAAVDGAPQLRFDDDGVGLDEPEVHRFLATLGESSKRRTSEAGAPIETDLIGQFGIGLLACFLVADEIVVHTRSARSPTARTIEWRGRQDGTYSVAEAAEPRAKPGTSVTLRARSDRREWFALERVEALLRQYGSLLRWPIFVGDGGDERRVNGEPPPWRQKHESPAALDRAVLAYGRLQLGCDFLDWIPLRSDSSGTDGVAYVLPFEPSFATPRTHRVHLKGMRVSEHSTQILPGWAFFVHAIVDSSRLRPTASREALVEDEALETTKEELGDCLRGWLVHMGKENPHRVIALIGVHHRAIKALAASDDGVLDAFADFLPFETTSGRLTFAELRERGRSVEFAPTIDAFRQMAPVATAQGKLLVNAGYSYDAECLARCCERSELSCSRVDAAALTNDLDDLDPAQQERVGAFIDAAVEVLAPCGCDVSMKSFKPEELPAFFASSHDYEFRRSLERTQAKTKGIWGDVLGAIQRAQPKQTDKPIICFNYRNPLVRRLAQLDDPSASAHAIRLLYVHALLLGHHPLSPVEQQLLPQAILGLVDWGLEARAGANRLQ